MAKTLAIKALQRGVGSMDYVDSILLLEPDDENSSDQEPDLDANTSPVRVPQPSRQSIDQEPVPEWCKCTYCRTMPQEVENKCCGRRNCVSQGRRFRKLCLDAEYLQLCSKNTADIPGNVRLDFRRSLVSGLFGGGARAPFPNSGCNRA